MNISESYKALKHWSNEHYGLIALAFGVVSLGLAFVQTNRLQNQAIILDYKMSVIEGKLDKAEELERERIAYQYDTSKQLREIKGYTQGVQDTKFRELINKLPNEAR
jgi:hypothetical protein